jgi:hypothetical protein
MPAAVLVTFALWSIAWVGFLAGWLLGSVVAAVSWLTVWFLLGRGNYKIGDGYMAFRQPVWEASLEDHGKA